MSYRTKIFATLVAVVTLALCLQTASAYIQCKATHFDLVGTYTLGKQDELNCTFKKFNEKFTPLDNVTLVVSDTTQYTIYNAMAKFYYRDSQQKAKVLGKNMIVIYGGKVQASLTFNWTKKSVLTRNGTGQAFGLSTILQLAKNITIENDSSYSYDLADASSVEWEGNAPFSLTRYDPADITDEDKINLSKMLNNILQVKTVRNLLEEEIEKAYRFYLGACLHDEHFHIDSQFDYKYVPTTLGKQNITISMVRKPYTIDVQTDGIRATFEVQPEDANNSSWVCGDRKIPEIPLFPKVYGGTQQFVSYDFYANMIRYAIGKGYLDTELKREWWQSRMFQFFAGDLYEIFPLMATKYYASQEILGNCKASYTGLKVWRAGYDTFNVSMHFDCELNILREKFVDFGINLDLEIAGVPFERNMTFRLRRHNQNITFYPYGQFKMENEELAKLMVQHSINTLYHGYLYGSGWPQSPARDYPHFVTEENYTIVYDSTHVDPHMILDEEEYLQLGDTQ